MKFELKMMNEKLNAVDRVEVYDLNCGQVEQGSE